VIVKEAAAAGDDGRSEKETGRRWCLLPLTAIFAEFPAYDTTTIVLITAQL